MLFPPDIKVLGEICLQGYLDAARFLEKNDLGNGPPPPCPSLSPEELEVVEGPRDTRSLEAPREGAGWRTRLERDELLNHLCPSLQPWDQSVLQTMSPELTAGFQVLRSRDSDPAGQGWGPGRHVLNNHPRRALA
ncbi:patatin like phospholipase domain containing 3 [Phyllostomus discolor]|uniref:Patatin like phospholipase domain containing 3 n=1 Tax=Phyllostomus discolor TaxID=89673 RepID=A0A834B1W7_9CHIR|nr:patatin like phospholipase domain containing 3 [Phyllostomus discolor]